MSGPTLDLAALERGAREVLALFPQVAAAYLFGSAARGELHAGSDIDIGLVLRERGVHAADCHRMIGDIASRLDSVTAPRPVDVVLLEEQGPVFCHDVLLEGRRIYESDRERRIDFESDTLVRAFDFRPTWEIAARGQVDGLRRWLKKGRA